MTTVIEVPLHHRGQVIAKLSIIGVPWSDFLKDGQTYVDMALIRRGLKDCFAYYGEAYNITHKYYFPIYVKPKAERSYTALDEERQQLIRAEMMEKAMEQKLERIRMSNYKRRFGR
jgi:hypothetical protein